MAATQTLTLYFMLSILSLFSSFFIIKYKKVALLRKKKHHLLHSIARNSSSPLPPCPNLRLPVFGNLLQMILNKPTYKWIHKIMEEMKTDISCIRLGSVNVITVTSPELAREFFKKQDSIFSSRPLTSVAEMVSYGYLSIILSPYGHQWKKMKRVLVSSMTGPTKYDMYSKAIFEEANQLISYILNQCNNSITRLGAVINVRTAARHYSANVMKRMIFSKIFFGKGTDDNGGPGVEDEEHVDALFVILAYIHSFSISDLLPWMKYFDLDGHQRIVSEALATVTKYHDREINERILMWEKGLKHKEVDFLDVLIMLKDDNGRPLLSMQEIKALILDLMLATIDNPSNAVEWTLAEMINQPELLEKTTKELDTIVGKERLVEEFDIPKLNYINACIMESFRLHPIAPFNIPHLSTENAIVSDYFIPKDSYVLVSRHGIGRNPSVWVDETLRFKPERHLIQKEEKKYSKNNNNSSYETLFPNLSDPELNVFSFSTGRRGCPGVAIGSTMCTLMMARLIQGFTWTAPPEISHIDLTECKNDLFLKNPLLAFAKPRLPNNLYA